VHMGLVYDEYGAFQGVVTSADILESIVGGFKTEEGPAEPAAVQRDDGSYLISGWMPVDEFADLLSIPVPEIRGYHTVAGFVLHDFGTLPEVGGSFERNGWRFEVMDMDGRRIDKILATRLEVEAARQAQQQEATLRHRPKKNAQAK
jgi:putative hemolysin